MNLLICFLFLLASYTCVHARETGETEITAEEGIEVFQNEKYYLLKKNVIIESDNFRLLGDIVNIFFEKDLYDIKKVEAEGNVKLNSLEHKLIAEGNKLKFEVESEKIFISGKNSKLNTKDIQMLSDGEIEVSNISGDFFIKGKNSSLNAQDIYILGNKIDGKFDTTEISNKIIFLDVFDKDIGYVKTENTDMYANIIKYNDSISLIELENNVKIIRDGETITGDYGTLDTNTNSYKVKSNNTKKVKVIIKDTNE